VVLGPLTQDDQPPVIRVRPFGGREEETTAIHLGIETVEPADLPPPRPEDLGDFRSARLLREAARLGLREGTAPLRCLGKIAVEPRPYQLVPLLMALKLDPVRLLIADDVGVGKTVEACLVVREMLDRGEIRRFSVLCPPSLAEQWQRELEEKFHLDAQVVLPGTIARLEREVPPNTSVFHHFPYTVVSTDFIKSDRRWLEFVQACPEMVVVDEAHGCADQSGGRGATQRYRLVAKLAEDRRRHLVLVTATPHTGKDEAFRNLVGFLDPRLAEELADSDRAALAETRSRLARHLVLRQRAHIARYLGTETTFPVRNSSEVAYSLTREMKEFLQEVLRFCRQRVAVQEGSQWRQRLRWWSALALLRAASSSPQAASATLERRAIWAEGEELEELGRRELMDAADEESPEASDIARGAVLEEEEGSSHRKEIKRLKELADRLKREPNSDSKLREGIAVVRKLLDQGFSPVVFCKFIDTAEYVAAQLSESFGGWAHVAAVTGRLPLEEREERVADLMGKNRRVLVATDCLSEGINLQEGFDAVVHYDLAWNPTRHEQREGRVDRFGQKKGEVQCVMLYGADNPVDGIVLDVLLRKHREIKKHLGVTVPVPESEGVLETILQGLLLRMSTTAEGQLRLFDDEEFVDLRGKLHARWDESREKASRSKFAQESIKEERLTDQLKEVSRSLGSPEDVRWFVTESLKAFGASVDTDGEVMVADLSASPSVVRERIEASDRVLRARFSPPAGPNEVYLTRTHPVVESLSSLVLEGAMDQAADKNLRIAARAGVTRTRALSRRTTLLLLRWLFGIRYTAQPGEHLAEEVALAAFEGSPDSPRWLDGNRAEELLSLRPDANVPAEVAQYHLGSTIAALEALYPDLEALARGRAAEIQRGHVDLREAASIRLGQIRVEPKPPVGVLGVYVYLPYQQAQ
jgi:superfamily II DNA or RNA helicase